MSKKIFCFPCAGGNAGNFNKIIKNFDWDVYCIEYSGHWTRYNERLYISMEDCIESLYNELIELMSERDEIFLLGHSMGALISYEIAVRLVTRGFNVKALFLLACMPPDEMDFSKLNFRNDSEIKTFLNQIRQVPDNVLDSEFFEENLLPTIRNDFRILRDYVNVPHQNTTITADFVCIEGTKDPLVENMRGWKKYTDSSFTCISFEGNHFFFYDLNNVENISEIISEIVINCQPI